jgi:hypothetical protein
VSSREALTASGQRADGVKGYAVLTLEFRKEPGGWVGVCRELGTATDGRSLDRVRTELAELVLLTLNGLEDLGDRERVFTERGITFYTERPPARLQTQMPVDRDDGDDGVFVQLRALPIASPKPPKRAAA